MELWKDIPDYEGIYQVSNTGKVRGVERIDSNSMPHKERILKAILTPNGYLHVHISKNNIGKWLLVHRLVAEAFCEKPNGCDIVNHIDNNRENNEASNLEWTTYKGNMQHASKQGRMHYNPKNLKRAQELRKKPVIAIKGDEILYFESAMDAEKMGFNHRHISNCCNGKYGYKTHKGYEWRFAI